MQEIKCPKCGEVFTVDEAGYAAIVSQIKNKEFTKELDERLKQLNETKNKDIELMKDKFKAEQDKAELEYKHKIESLEKQIEYNKEIYSAEKEKAIEEIKQENFKLKSQINLSEKDKTIAINEVLEKTKEELNKKEQEIITLKGNIEIVKREEEALKEKHKNDLKVKDEVIEFYKDYKTKLSTKMLGETLEQHCLNEFNKIRATAFPKAFFDKDNDAKSGSKGDFIFRDFTDSGVEYVSIMFEMKNEMETTSKKHKNEDFFKELDKDRNEKGCEYAVLVSMLESDNEFYNIGIADVSYKYPKMYVIRPQFFITLITVLRNAALNSVSYKNELAEYKQKNIDITNFEDKLKEFKEGFQYNYDHAGTNFKNAIEQIDNTISKLEEIKESLRKTENHLRLANDKLQDITIKRLTRNNPTMTEKFKEAEKKKEEEDDGFSKLNELGSKVNKFVKKIKEIS